MTIKDNIINFSCGALAGATVDTILFPLDTIKTRLQASKSSVRVKPKSSLFRGLLPALAGSVPSSAAYWCVYEYMKKTLSPHVSDSRYFPLVHLLSVGCADVVTVAVRNPFELLKNTMQVDSYKSTLSALGNIYRIHGVRGYFMGYMSLLFREIPFDSIEFVLYEYLKQKAIQRKNAPLTLTENMVLGSISGGMAGFLTTPLDVIKTRTMLKAGESEKKSVTYIDTIKTLYKQEGWRVFFKGCMMRLIWISLGGALYFGSYEEFKRQLLRI